MDAAEILNTGPHSAGSISAIVLSHLHFDHIGDCHKFPHASVIVGPGSRAATMPGYPSDIESPFLGSVLDHPGFREFSLVSDKWVPVGPFPRAYDYFGDGSFYILDTPGHMQGHLSGLAQTGPQEWVFMGGGLLSPPRCSFWEEACEHYSRAQRNKELSPRSPNCHQNDGLGKNTGGRWKGACGTST